MADWISPTSFSDPSSDWTNEPNIYDESTGTYAGAEVDGAAQWTGFLELILPSQKACTKIQFHIQRREATDKVDIDIWNGSEWLHVYEGTFPNNTWFEHTFDLTNITKYRVRWWEGAGGAWHWTAFNETDAYGADPATPPTVQTNPADNIDHEQATLHGTLTDDGGEPCEVRFQYGKTTGYGTDTDWQPEKQSEATFQQLLTALDPDQTYHFRAQAKNSAATSSGTDAQFTTSILPPVYGAMKKAQITHPALKTVRIIQHGQQVAKFDELSNPDQHYIESGLTIPIPTPSTIEVTTLADQVYEFNIPEK